MSALLTGLFGGILNTKRKRKREDHYSTSIHYRGQLCKQEETRTWSCWGAQNHIKTMDILVLRVFYADL